MCKLISIHCVNYIYLSMIDIINTFMYRFYTYYKYIIIIVIYSSLKLQKWFSQEQWEIF